MKPRKIDSKALGSDRLHSIMAEALQRPCVAIVINYVSVFLGAACGHMFIKKFCIYCRGLRCLIYTGRDL